MKLKDQVAVVTGGGGGLGQGICLALAREGAHVVVSDLNPENAEMVAKKIKELDRKATAVATDVRSAAQCEELIQTSIREMGTVDILVCAAGEGGFSLRGDSTAPAVIENISEEQWDLTIGVNLKGVFLCNKAVIPHLKEKGRGKIINISSIGGRKGIDFISHYCASKAGVIVLTQSIALQLAPFNINVNTVCPGVIWTPMWEMGAKVLADTYPPFKGMSPDKIFAIMMEQMIPLKRAQSPEDIGNAVVFLASPEADQITGQAINIDGGAVFN